MHQQDLGYISNSESEAFYKSISLYFSFYLSLSDFLFISLSLGFSVSRCACVCVCLSRMWTVCIWSPYRVTIPVQVKFDLFTPRVPHADADHFCCFNRFKCKKQREAGKQGQCTADMHCYSPFCFLSWGDQSVPSILFILDDLFMSHWNQLPSCTYIIFWFYFILFNININ